MRALTLLGCTAALFVAASGHAQSSTPGATASPSASAAQSKVDPESVAALKRMSTYLSSLNSFRLTSNASIDLVTMDNQRLQIDAVIKYQVKRPGMVIDFASDQKTRRYYYDGKQFTIYAPKLGFYASVPAPPTNREFLKAVYEKTGVSLPLEDLFRWADNDDSDIQKLISGYSVGTATLDGVQTDHWAFRQSDFDWEIWIETGDRPVPRKLVIIDRTDESHPGFIARLSWELNPVLADADFTFVPGADAKRINFATVAGGQTAMAEDKK